MSKSKPCECPNCGAFVKLDEYFDYVELLHELMEAQFELRQAQARADYWEKGAKSERMLHAETLKQLGDAYEDIAKRAAIA